MDPGGAAIFGQETDARQMDLLRDEQGRLPANVFQLIRQEPERGRGPGRPKGAKNKQNDDIAKYLAHKHYPDPVEYMASIYAMPLDQFVEALLIADGTIERQQRLDELLEGLTERVDQLSRTLAGSTAATTADSVNRLAEACEALEKVARNRAGKPGEVAIKAINVQLAAAKSVAEYWHSKKPVDVNVKAEDIPVIVMPGAGSANFQQGADLTDMAAELLAKALKNGRIEPVDCEGLQLIDGQLRRVEDGEFVDVESDDDAEGEE